MGIPSPWLQGTSQDIQACRGRRSRECCQCKQQREITDKPCLDPSRWRSWAVLVPTRQELRHPVCWAGGRYNSLSPNARDVGIVPIGARNTLVIEGKRPPAIDLVAYISFSSIEGYCKQMRSILILCEDGSCAVAVDMESNMSYFVVLGYRNEPTAHPSKQYSRAITPFVSVCSIRGQEVTLPCASRWLPVIPIIGAQRLNLDYETEKMRDATGICRWCRGILVIVNTKSTLSPVRHAYRRIAPWRWIPTASLHRRTTMGRLTIIFQGTASWAALSGRGHWKGLLQNGGGPVILDSANWKRRLPASGLRCFRLDVVSSTQLIDAGCHREAAEPHKAQANTIARTKGGGYGSCWLRLPNPADGGHIWSLFADGEGTRRALARVAELIGQENSLWRWGGGTSLCWKWTCKDGRGMVDPDSLTWRLSSLFPPVWCVPHGSWHQACSRPWGACWMVGYVRLNSNWRR